ncbi:hypothetical protein M758_11G053700 [Ceratodon purpureus]|nr:hypothetical protein M758_11G053700 [Ceratodon purpureus]KAG0600691.1 hypothetical protein M758_11G053700 [Ceratodon purpureus]KAG0600692.1 hypothetical protein M758_11G053700 [Ceratodon purpureus]
MGVSWSTMLPGAGAEPAMPDGIKKISDRVYSLSEPKAGPPEIEIVFVHGLQFSDYKDAFWRTWIAGVKDEDGTEIFWPKAWLGDELPRARILSLSYDSSAWRTNKQGLMDAYVVGETLVQEMVGMAKVGQHKNCPVVFVAHSLGGLMVKEIVCKAQGKFRNDLKFQNFLQNIGGFLFYATPHDGAKLADTAAKVPNMGEMVRLLGVINKELGRLNSQFKQIAAEEFAGKWEFVVVAVTHVTEFYGISAMVVEEASARHGYKTFYSVSEDHFGVCKPKERTNTSYMALLQLLELVTVGKSLTLKSEMEDLR